MSIYLDTVLRVPGWFLLEKLFKFDIKFYVDTYERSSGKSGLELHIILSTLALIVFSLSLAVIFLPFNKLTELYKLSISLAMIIINHFISMHFISIYQHLSSYSLLHLIPYLLLPPLSGLLISYLLHFDSLPAHLLSSVYVLPPLYHLITIVPVVREVVSEGYLLFLPETLLVSQCLTLISTCWFLSGVAPSNWDDLLAYCQHMISLMKLEPLPTLHRALTYAINSLPLQLLIFWILLFIIELFRYSMMNELQSEYPFTSTWYLVLIGITSSCCSTPPSLLGLCSAVSYLTALVLTTTRLYLLGSSSVAHLDGDGRRWTEAISLLLLALQTRLIDLRITHRAALLGVMLIVLLSSLLQSMLEVLEPVLLSLGTLFTTRPRPVIYHIRALALALILFLAPTLLLHFLSSFFHTTGGAFWLLVIGCSCLLTSCQVTAALLTYCLHMYDHCVAGGSWRHLDQSVHITRCIVRVLEFVVALCVLIFGAGELISGGEISVVNSCVLLLHCYSNIWCRVSSAWLAFKQRRHTAYLLQSLDEPDEGRVTEYSDVCSICQQDLALVGGLVETRCHHIYHTHCLRRWLYCENFCPLCHTQITRDEEIQERDDEGNGEIFGDINQNGPDINSNEMPDQNLLLNPLDVAN